jgi:Na+/melibiose symporter-like transporter
MMPPELFGSRQFSVTNLVTFVMYGALGGLIFMLGLQLQIVVGFSALLAGASMLPSTVLMLLFSARAAALAERIGPRWPMTIGTAVAACGVLAMIRIGPGAGYLTEVLPAATVFGLGLTLTVAPLTATALAAAPVERAGVASGVNNAVARVAGLLAVAGLPVLAGLAGPDVRDPAALDAGFGRAMVACAGLLALGSVIALAGIRRPAS